MVTRVIIYNLHILLEEGRLRQRFIYFQLESHITFPSINSTFDRSSASLVVCLRPHSARQPLMCYGRNSRSSRCFWKVAINCPMLSGHSPRKVECLFGRNVAKENLSSKSPAINWRWNRSVYQFSGVVH